MEQLLILDNVLPQSGGAPKEFLVLPLGRVHSSKGDFLVDNESYESIRKAFKARQLQIPIDYEHQTLMNVEAPAAGWITDLILKETGIYAAVNWTDRGAEYIARREYRYCSPVINVRNSDRKAMNLHSVALTNTPAIDAMIPIINKSSDIMPTPPSAGKADKDITPAPPQETHSDGEQSADLSSIAQLLELSANASVSDIYKRLLSLIDEEQEVNLRADEMAFKSYKQEVDTVVHDALQSGKITPAMRSWAFKYAMTDIDEFRLFLKSAPQAVPFGEIKFSDDNSTTHRGSRSDELMGLSHDDIKRYR